MLKLKKRVTDKLKAFEFTQVDFSAIESLCLSEDRNAFIKAAPVYLEFCEGASTEFLITVECFETVLDCGKWYARELFNDNPDNFILVEEIENGDFIASGRNSCNHALCADTVAFMFLQPSGKQNTIKVL